MYTGTKGSEKQDLWFLIQELGKQATRARTLDNGEATKNKNGTEMLMFLKNNEIKTLKDRAKKPGPE